MAEHLKARGTLLHGDNLPDPYAPGNLFVGKYDVPEDGWVKLDRPRVRYMRQLPSKHAFLDDDAHSRQMYPDAPLWLIVEDDDGFWPVMVMLEAPIKR